MKHCCARMSEMVAYTCKQHPNRFDCPDCLVDYVPTFDEYGILVHDGGASEVSIAYCPWCGARLAKSKRERWFDELEALGFDSPFEQEIPERYKSDAWWRALKT